MMRRGLVLLLLTQACLPFPGPRPEPTAPTRAALSLDGRSNIRRFHCVARAPSAFVARRDRARFAPGDTAWIATTSRALDCGIGQMNGHLREAIGHDSSTAIRFDLDSLVRLPGDSVALIGRLTIGGRTEVLRASATWRDDGVRGSTPIDIRRWGIAAPRRFGGLLRVRPLITVHFFVPT
jgi:hypothetical protein